MEGRGNKLQPVGRFFNSKVFEDIKSSKIFKNSKVKNLMSCFIYLEDQEISLDFFSLTETKNSTFYSFIKQKQTRIIAMSYS